jgi:hypothetical protein
VWESAQLFPQGVTGTLGSRRSAYAQTRFTTGAADVAGGPAGLVVETLTTSWNAAAWPGQIEAGINVNGVNLPANHNGLVPIPGFIQTEGYGLMRAIDCPGIVAGAGKAVVITDGMQTMVSGTVASTSTALFVRVPDTDSITWTTRAAPATQYINVFDSKGGQIEGLNQEAGIINPTYSAWPMIHRANAGAARVACDGWGSGTWSHRISSAGTRAATVTTLQRLAVGTVSNQFWIELGTNDYGLNTYANLATFESDLALFVAAMVALGLPGFKLRLVGPTTRTNEATNNGNGWNLPQLRTSISNVVTAAANANVTYVNAAAFVSGGNLPDGLHPSQAGHIEYEGNKRAVEGY